MVAKTKGKGKAAVEAPKGKATAAPPAILMLPLSLLGLYVFALIYHVGAKLCGGTGSLAETYRVLGYSWGAVMLKLVPSIGSILSLVAHVVMCVFGFARLHRISIGRSVVVLVIPTVLTILLLIGATVALVFILAQHPEVLSR